jgi:preprotein translocase subunit SecG
MRYNNIMRIFIISLFAIWIITVITLVTENRYLRKQNTELKLKIKD